jgi:hypothetical protein
MLEFLAARYPKQGHAYSLNRIFIAKHATVIFAHFYNLRRLFRLLVLNRLYYDIVKLRRAAATER